MDSPPIYLHSTPLVVVSKNLTNKPTNLLTKEPNNKQQQTRSKTVPTTNKRHSVAQTIPSQNHIHFLFMKRRQKKIIKTGYSDTVQVTSMVMKCMTYHSVLFSHVPTLKGIGRRETACCKFQFRIQNGTHLPCISSLLFSYQD